MYGEVSPNQERKYPMSFTKPKAKPAPKKAAWSDEEDEESEED